MYSQSARAARTAISARRLHYQRPAVPTLANTPITHLPCQARSSSSNNLLRRRMYGCFILWTVNGTAIQGQSFLGTESGLPALRLDRWSDTIELPNWMCLLTLAL